MADEIAYRDLKPGEVIQAGDQWQAESGQWHQWCVAFPETLHHGKCKARRLYNITDLLRQRNQAAHEYRLYREALTVEQEAHKATAANGVQTCKDRDRLIVELNECQQQRQHLQAALDELQRRQDAVAGADAMAVGEVVENILSALEIASHALEYLADVGVNEEPGHYCGFSAAIAVVKKIKESTK